MLHVLSVKKITPFYHWYCGADQGRRGSVVNKKPQELRFVSRLRLLRDSHLVLEIETLKENSRLILSLDSQFFHENSHPHSQLSFSNSQKMKHLD